nr:MAG TPA: hypothetical protein [Caudoviricetes sp.]
MFRHFLELFFGSRPEFGSITIYRYEVSIF